MFVIELYYRHTPKTCYNIAALAASGYYDNTIFHRIIRDFMVQGGDPTATGRGYVYAFIYIYRYIYITHREWMHIEPHELHFVFSSFLRGESIYGGTFNDEITRNLKHTGAGVVSMANAGPNTNTSQFFVTLSPTPFLDGKHTIFGRIYSGMGVIQRMGLVPTDTEDKSKIPVVIHRATPFQGPPMDEDDDVSSSFPYQSYESKVSQITSSE